jgi:hypothetical protein
MQIAAQIEKAPATARECRGHCGNHFIPVAVGDGHWVYYWLTPPQLWFWRARSAMEAAALARDLGRECFVCNLERALEKELLYGDEG